MSKRKSTRAEHRAMQILEAAGYAVTRSSPSRGLFDVVSIDPLDVRLVQVKAGTARLSSLEREAIQGLAVPANVVKDAWRFPDRCRAPLIERPLCGCLPIFSKRRVTLG